MPATFEIHATFDAESITVYQAFNHAIADAALEAGTFVAPFSMNRMTWIKPSFLWLMERSNWAQKPGQERVLAIRIRRPGWDEALALGTLTHPEPKIWPDPDASRTSTRTAGRQWDFTATTQRTSRRKPVLRSSLLAHRGRSTSGSRKIEAIVSVFHWRAVPCSTCRRKSKPTGTRNAG